MGTSIPSAAQEHMLARDILEHAVLLSVHLRDSEGFARSFTQLAVHYEACAALGSLPPSQKELPILGLNLLRLLVENRTAEFQAELELLGSDAVNSSVYIRYPVEIEQCLMEGSYAKVLALRQEAPSPECAYSRGAREHRARGTRELHRNRVPVYAARGRSEHDRVQTERTGGTRANAWLGRRGQRKHAHIPEARGKRGYANVKRVEGASA